MARPCPLFKHLSQTHKPLSLSPVPFLPQRDMPPIPKLSPTALQFVQAIRSRKPTLKITREDHIRGLIQFLADNNEQYCKSIRGLHFAIGAIEGDVAAMLEYCIETWGKLMPLKWLRFEDAEGLLVSGLELPQAFAALETVKHIYMNNVGPSACDMLLKMRSSLISADLCLSDGQKCSPDEKCYSDPIYLLSASQDTLIKLKACDATTDTPENHRQQYPHLHTLKLDCVDKPCTTDYVVAFPALRSLTIVSAIPYSRRDVFAKCEEYRKANQEQQRQYGSWTKGLAVVTGPLFDVYALGLCCSVDVMKLAITLASEGVYHTMLRAVVEDSLPPVLELMTDPDTIIDDGLIYALDGETIRNFHFMHLKITINVDRDIYGHRVKDTRVSTLSTIVVYTIERLIVAASSRSTLSEPFVVSRLTNFI